MEAGMATALATAPRTPAQEENRAKWLTLGAMCFALFMMMLDNTVVNIALPTLTKSLGNDLYQVKWVVVAYLLVITCLLLPIIWKRK